MKYNIINKNDKNYIKYSKDDYKISSEQDVLDVISVCFETGINSIIMDGEILSDEFYDLSTKLLGIALQKFINYRVRIAFIIDEEKALSDRFKELVSELNKAANFRVCYTVENAEKWLLA